MSVQCKHEKQLSAYLDDALSSREKERLTDHLATCPDCRRMLADLRATDHFFSIDRELAPSPDFDATFWRKVRQEEGKQRRPMFSGFQFMTWRPALAAAITLLVVVAAGFMVYLRHPWTAPKVSLAIAEDIDFYEHYEILQNFELMEDWDAIETLNEKS